MSDQHSPPDAAAPLLRFACDCVSAAPVAQDPWEAVSKDGKFHDGTKELILNALHRRPHSGTQLAQILGLSPPAVHRHVTELLARELIRETAAPNSARRSPAERYYRLNFPVVLAPDRRAFLPLLDRLADQFAAAFRAEQPVFAEVFARTSLPDREERFEALLHYLYTSAVRRARAQLEAEGVLPPWTEHEDGSRWIWWAEEPLETEAP